MTPPLRVALLVDPISARAPNAARVKAARHALELAPALEARGHVARVFGVPSGWGPGQTVESDPDRVVRRLDAYQPDAVLAYDALSPAAWLGSRLARRRRVPLVLIEAGSFAQGSWMERAAWRLGEVLWGTFVRRAAGALVALDPVASAVALREGFRAESVTVLPHGVDVERFRPGLPSALVARHRIRGRILLHPGPLDARSGAELLIEAFARTLGRRDDWSLVLACEESVPQRLRACADRLGISARVHAVQAGEDESPGLYSSSTLVALPYVDDGPLGGVAARALACGRPLLASDLPRLAHVVQPSGVGLLASASGGVQAWVETLRQAVSDPEARNRWGANGRALALRELDWQRIAAALERVIQGAATRARNDSDPDGPLPVERAG
jgi:glycosyltransferase involved in cell wall biosynthesis